MAREGYPEYDVATAQRKAQIIEQRGKELERDRSAYLEALSAVDGRTDGKDMVDLARLLKSYQAGESSEKAIYILAQAAMLVNKLVMPFAIVRNYEVKEQELEKLRK